MDPLSNVVFAKDGLIRVECVDCQLNYTLLNDSKSFSIRDNQDITFSYVSDVELKTTINVEKEQNIRLVVFDSYGRMVSNELSTLNQGAHKISNFKISLK